MSEYQDLLQVIRSRICENRNISHSSYYHGSQLDYQIRNRTAFIFTLEIVLHQHRIKYATIFDALDGRSALYHLIFMKTHWQPTEIRKISFEDTLFVMQEDLRIDNLNIDAQEALSNFNPPSIVFRFEDFPESDWNYKENSIFLRSLMLKASQ
ncbi:hypothetical protein [Kosakonia sp. S42]|uniref:ECs1072 family phage-associated protein n=1 Tax=Kosakonia sp. S42 TaxID=2767458 RepID=UPI00190E5A1A|nr:hypothetical protein [Kosakonia sp. S42]MBK0018755.1 hypothetical protein [Kosakonia sp. S42]